MFFEDYFNGLLAHLTGYVSTMTGTVATALTPVIISFATMYVMFWGWLHLSGKIEEPVIEGAKRIITLGVILSLCLTLWSNHSYLVLAFLNGPMAFASSILNAPTPLGAVDNIWTQGNNIAGLFWSNASLFNGNFGLYFAALATWLICGILCAYTAFMFALSSIALSILLAVAPLFLMFLFFDATKRFFESWIAQLANYALIVIVASLIAALVLGLVSNMANSTYAVGATLKVTDALDFLLSVVLAFLLMRQTMSIASGLASGVALATGGIVSGLMRRGLSGGGAFSRGMMDAAMGFKTSQYQGLTRIAGNTVASGVGQGARAGWRKITPHNSIKR
ncbi:MAG: type IV secretion system protein [Pseudomonadota bacterium]|nr:type IV secretion system protein [Pseudomonadota bacterium]